MIPTANPTPPADMPATPAAGSLSTPERAELQRQGAKAAARGEPASNNPLSQARNQPPATGESGDTWLQRSDAWQQGHQAQSVAGRNVQPTAAQGDAGDEHD